MSMRADMEPWEVAARLAIRGAVEENFFHYDHDDMAAAYAVFTEDGVLELPPGQRVRRGRADILERFSHRPDGRLGDYGYVRHNVTNHHVTHLAPTAASAVTYYLVHSDGAIVSAGVFHDDFVVVDGAWLISRRRIAMDFATVPVATDAVPSTSSEEPP